MKEPSWLTNQVNSASWDPNPFMFMLLIYANHRVRVNKPTGEARFVGGHLPSGLLGAVGIEESH